MQMRSLNVMFKKNFLNTCFYVHIFLKIVKSRLNLYEFMEESTFQFGEMINGLFHVAICCQSSSKGGSLQFKVHSYQIFFSSIVMSSKSKKMTHIFNGSIVFSFDGSNSKFIKVQE